MLTTTTVINTNSYNITSQEESINMNGRKTITPTAARYLCRQLRTMIRSKDWDGIDRMLQECQHTTTATTSIGTAETVSIEKVIQVIISNDLQFDILKNIDDERAKAVFFTLFRIGGKNLVMAKDRMYGQNPLSHALRNNKSFDALLKLVEMGGKELVTAKDSMDRNSLHMACAYNASFDVVSKLIEVGGKELVMAKDSKGWNTLHTVCWCNASVDVVSKLVEVGGMELVMAKECDHGWSTLHMTCRYNAPFDVVSKLVEAGGKELVMAKDKYDHNPTQVALTNYGVCTDVLDLLIQYEGREALMKVNSEDMTPFYTVITFYGSSIEITARIERAAFLITKGIKLQVGGEYGIGGLFSSHTHTRKQQEQKDQLYARWDEVVFPALDQVMDLPDCHRQPLLQALIVNKAPPEIIDSTLNCFADSINIVDSSGNYPIDIAVCHELAWDDGTKQIVEGFASAQQTTVFHACIKHGVQWENGTKEVLEGSDVDIVEREDVSTGLYPFMVAAAKERYVYDFDSVFHLIKASPKLVQSRFGGNHGEEQHARKRQRRV